MTMTEADYFLENICMMGRDGQCGLAGSEECDFECPRWKNYHTDKDLYAPPWTWWNTREVGLAFYILPMPWQWRIKVERYEENSFAEWMGWVQVGPVLLKLRADIGNISTGTWRARFGLSENEAWERAERRAGRGG